MKDLDSLGLSEVELRHQVQPKGVLRRQAQVRPAFTMSWGLGCCGELQGSDLVFPVPMMFIFACSRFVKP